MIQFEVLGTPAPKGSSRAILRGGYAVNVPSGSDVNKERMKDWKSAVRHAAIDAMGGVKSPPFVNTPVILEIVFRLKRPADHWSMKPGGGLKPWAVEALPSFKPDLSKLVRMTEDVLTGIIYDDDARIVRHVIDKIYAGPTNEGATIRVREASLAIFNNAVVGWIKDVRAGP